MSRLLTAAVWSLRLSLLAQAHHGVARRRGGTMVMALERVFEGGGEEGVGRKSKVGKTRQRFGTIRSPARPPQHQHQQ